MRGFYVDKKQPGFVRGGFYDEMGGMLVGVKAQAVCDTLNAAIVWNAVFNGAHPSSEAEKNQAEDALNAAVQDLHS